MSLIFLQDAVKYKSTTQIVKTFTSPAYHFTHRCERVSGILHPCAHRDFSVFRHVSGTYNQRPVA